MCYTIPKLKLYINTYNIIKDNAFLTFHIHTYPSFHTRTSHISHTSRTHNNTRSCVYPC